MAKRKLKPEQVIKRGLYTSVALERGRRDERKFNLIEKNGDYTLMALGSDRKMETQAWRVEVGSNHNA